VQNGSVLLNCEYDVHFLFVVTDERGPGGMGWMTRKGYRPRVKQADRVPWAGPPHYHVQENKIREIGSLRIVESKRG